MRRFSTHQISIQSFREGQTYLITLVLACLSTLPVLGTPQTPDADLAKAHEQELHQDYSGAEVTYREALEKFPDELEVMKRLGILLQTELKFNNSIDLFHRILTFSAHYPEVNFYLGLSYFGLNDFEKSAEAFQRELTANPHDRRCRYYLALVYSSMADYFKAIEQLETQVREDPRDARVWYQLALLHEKASLRSIQRLSNLDPDSPYLYALKGAILADNNEYVEAARQYKMALLKNPNFLGLHFSLGEVFWKMGHMREGEEELRLALREDPNHPMANYYFAEIMIRDQKFHNAIPLLKISIAADPNFMEAHFLLGKCYESLGSLTEAIEELNKASRLKPDNPSPHYVLSHAYARLNKVDKSKRELDIFEQLTQKKQQEDIKRANENFEREKALSKIP